MLGHRRICVSPCLPPQIREGCGQGLLSTTQLRNYQLHKASTVERLHLEQLDIVKLWSYHLLYNSTISCSCTGRLICARVGSEAIRPVIEPASNESHSGTPRPFTSSSAC